MITAIVAYLIFCVLVLVVCGIVIFRAIIAECESNAEIINSLNEEE